MNSASILFLAILVVLLMAVGYADIKALVGLLSGSIAAFCAYLMIWFVVCTTPKFKPRYHIEQLKIGQACYFVVTRKKWYWMNYRPITIKEDSKVPRLFTSRREARMFYLTLI